MADILGLANYVQQQGAMGKEAGQRSRLAKLYSSALAAPEDQRDSFLPQMAAESPEVAMQAQGQFSGMRKQAFDDLGREAGMFVVAAQSSDPATAQQAYQRLAARAQAAGHPVPPQYDPKMLPMIEKLASMSSGQSSELQTFNSMTAGMKPEDVARARRIQLGLDPRAVTGAIKFDTFTGADGRPRPQRNNPTTGGIEIYDDNFGWVPLGASGQPQGAPMQGVPTDSGVPVQAGAMLNPTQDYQQLASAFPGTQISSTLRSPSHNAEVGGVPNSQHIRGTAGDFVVPKAEQAAFIARAKSMGYEVIPEGDHVHIELPPGRRAAGSFSAPIAGLGVGRRAEDEAFAKEQATQAAQLGFLPQRGQIEAQNAGLKEAATQGVQLQTVGPKKEAELAAERRQKALTDLPLVLQSSQQTMSVIDKALNHPGLEMATGLSSKLDPRNLIPGSPGYNFNVVMDQLRGKAFLEAFQSLKGGGQITEVEGKKATEAIARLNTAQSKPEFVAALRELRQIAQNARERALRAVKGGAPQAPQGGQVDDLLSKYGVK